MPVTLMNIDRIQLNVAVHTATVYFHTDDERGCSVMVGELLDYDTFVAKVFHDTGHLFLLPAVEEAESTVKARTVWRGFLHRKLEAATVYDQRHDWKPIVD